jgi:hypothetical protein
MTIHSIIGNDLDYYYYSTPPLLRDSLISAVSILAFIPSTVGSIMRWDHSL